MSTQVLVFLRVLHVCVRSKMAPISRKFKKLYKSRFGFPQDRNVLEAFQDIQNETTTIGNVCVSIIKR